MKHYSQPQFAKNQAEMIIIHTGANDLNSDCLQCNITNNITKSEKEICYSNPKSFYERDFKKRNFETIETMEKLFKEQYGG